MCRFARVAALIAALGAHAFAQPREPDPSGSMSSHAARVSCRLQIRQDKAHPARHVRAAMQVQHRYQQEGRTVAEDSPCGVQT